MKKIKTRLLLYFGSSLLVFSVLIGLIFFVLFSRHSTDVHKDDLGRRAERMAATLGELMVADEPEGRSRMQVPGRGGKVGGQGYRAYLRFLDDIALTDVWVVDENREQIVRNQGKHDLPYKELPASADEVVRAALSGQTTYSEDFGTILGAPSLTVAAPIRSADGRIVGAVLLHEKITEIREVSGHAAVILLISIALGIVVSFFVSAALAKRFTSPLAQMKAAAQRISSGDYAARTGLCQDDELGELAASLDDMADKLAAAAAERQRTQQLRQDFVANISHELRTPVTVLRGSLEALSDGVVQRPEQVADYHQQMLQESIYLERLVTDLLELAKLQNTDFQIELQPVDLREPVADAVRSLKRLAAPKQVELRITEQPADYLLAGDYGRLRQMLTVVLDNAIKFSPPGAAVEVRLSEGRTAEGRRELQLEVADRGPGLSAEDPEELFERFNKQRSEENKSGTGLGLSIARQIAVRHGGTLEAESRPGTGSVFRFRLPPLTN